MKTLKDLFHHQLKDLYSAEKQFVEAMPKFIDASNSKDLTECLENHYKESKKHYDEIRAICDDLDVNPGSKVCKAMEGLLEEARGMANHEATADVKDAGLIAALQRVEHYEISGYGTAREYAELLGLHDAEARLKKILTEEQGADGKLNEIAKLKVNKAAKS